MIHREAWYIEADDDKVLLDNPWFLIKENSEGWVYQESGGTVAVLPFKMEGDFESVEFLIRHEVIPTIGKGLSPWMVFGGQQEHGDAEAAAVAELYEEAGFRVLEEDLIDLGEVWTRKDITKPCRIFAVDVTNRDQETPEGDGSEGEKDFKLEWVDWNGLVNHHACVLHSMALRLYARLYQK